MFGVAPDFFSFGILWLMTLLGRGVEGKLIQSHPIEADIPSYTHYFYNITHSLVIFAAVFLLVWLIRRKAYLPMTAWGLHILFDIPTHSTSFFGTPFLWPLSGYEVDGYSWGHPSVFFGNWIALVILYAVWFLYKKHTKIKPL